MGDSPGTLRQQWDRDGFVIQRGVFPPERIAALRVVVEDVFSQYLERDPDTGQPGDPEVNSMRHLHRTQYFTGRPERFVTLMELIADPRILSVVEVLLGAPPVFRDVSLWFNPFFKHEDGHWHRDIQYFARSDEEERVKLADSQSGRYALHVQVPLAFSDELEYIPGSHLRWDTPEEYAIRKADGGRNCRSNGMPGAVRLVSNPGDIQVLNPSGVHRGRYHAERFRRTLQITFTPPSLLHEYGSEQPWLLQPDGLAPLQGRVHEYFERCRQVLLARPGRLEARAEA